MGLSDRRICFNVGNVDNSAMAPKSKRIHLIERDNGMVRHSLGDGGVASAVDGSESRPYQ